MLENLHEKLILENVGDANIKKCAQTSHYFCRELLNNGYEKWQSRLDLGVRFIDPMKAGSMWIFVLFSIKKSILLYFLMIRQEGGKVLDFGCDFISKLLPFMLSVLNETRNFITNMSKSPTLWSNIVVGR